METASNICGISILEDTRLIYHLDLDTAHTHSEALMPMIKQALEETALTLKDIDLLVCDKGPGSFTGIRIGIATLKAFHDSLAIPCVGVTSLEALAYSVKKDGYIASIINCKNDNCYFAFYKLKNSNYTLILPPFADNIHHTLARCQECILPSDRITFVGDGCIAFKSYISQTFKNCEFAPYQNHSLNSYELALAGLDHWKQNKRRRTSSFLSNKTPSPKTIRRKVKTCCHCTHDFTRFKTNS